MILTDEPQNREASAVVFLPKTPFQTRQQTTEQITKKETSHRNGQTLKGMKSEEKLFLGGLQRGSSFLKAFFFFCGN